MCADLMGWCLFGLVAGGIARLLWPGDNVLGCLGTIALGIAGSVVGGFLLGLLTGANSDGIQPAGFLGAIPGALIVLWLARRLAGRPPTT